MRLRRRDADLQKPLREGKADRSVQGGLSRFITSRDRRNAGQNPSRKVSNRQQTHVPFLNDDGRFSQITRF